MVEFVLSLGFLGHGTVDTYHSTIKLPSIPRAGEEIWLFDQEHSMDFKISEVWYRPQKEKCIRVSCHILSQDIGDDDEVRLWKQSLLNLGFSRGWPEDE